MYNMFPCGVHITNPKQEIYGVNNLVFVWFWFVAQVGWCKETLVHLLLELWDSIATSAPYKWLINDTKTDKQ